VRGGQSCVQLLGVFFTKLQMNPFVEIRLSVCLSVAYNQRQNNTLKFHEILREIFLQNVVQETRVS